MATAPASPVADEFALLLYALAAVPHVRQRKGRRHLLPSPLGLMAQAEESFAVAASGPAFWSSHEIPAPPLSPRR